MMEIDSISDVDPSTDPLSNNNTGENIAAASNEDDTKGIDSIPLEILEHILSYSVSSCPAPAKNGALELRLVSKHWNVALIKYLVFSYDGNSELDAENWFFTKIVHYLISSRVNALPPAWTTLNIKNASTIQLYAWIQPSVIGHVKIAGFKNCDLPIATILDFLAQFVNIKSFSYENCTKSTKKVSVNQEGLGFNFDHLKNLKTIRLAVPLEVISSMLTFFNGYCKELENLSITIKNPISLMTSNHVLEIIGTTLRNNQHHLKTLTLDLEEPSIRTKDEFDATKHFFLPVYRLQWSQFEFPNLSAVHIEHTPVTVNTDHYRLYFFPFLRTLIRGNSLKSMEIGTIVVNEEYRYRQFVAQLNNIKTQHNAGLKVIFSVFVKYETTEYDTEPVRPEVSLSSMVIESSAQTSRIGMVVIRTSAPALKKLKILNRTNSLTDYGLHAVTNKYSSLRVLVVDERSVKKDCSAKIGDNEVQGIFRDLKMLETLKLSANMEGLTDSGLTGYRKSSCSAYLGRPSEEALNIQAHEPRAYSISSLAYLKHLALCGVGQGVTDLTLFLGMKNMYRLRDCSIIGKHQITEVGISYLKEKAGVSPAIKICIS